MLDRAEQNNAASAIFFHSARSPTAETALPLSYVQPKSDGPMIVSAHCLQQAAKNAAKMRRWRERQKEQGGVADPAGKSGFFPNTSGLLPKVQKDS